MTRTGTSYFITFERACRYYAAYEFATTKDELSRLVASKVAERLIHIGEPPIKKGEFRRIDEDGRYEVIGP